MCRQCPAEAYEHELRAEEFAVSPDFVTQPSTTTKPSGRFAVVDDAGHLLAFAGMDGAKLSSVKVPLTKAPAAAFAARSRRLRPRTSRA